MPAPVTKDMLDPKTPKSVVEEGFESFAAGFAGGDAAFASTGGDTSYLGAVADLTTLLPGTYHSGPGGVSGPSNLVGGHSLRGGQMFADCRYGVARARLQRGQQCFRLATKVVQIGARGKVLVHGRFSMHLRLDPQTGGTKNVRVDR